ncbi:MAG: gliding motility-associated C-terminal domain-containing protein [Bacteroidota bacterium]|nr:gliding motility-associated C-terminal domain-containing protein [Bacteroidota bacterium]
MAKFLRTYVLPLVIIALSFSGNRAQAQTVYMSDTICNPQGPMDFWVDSLAGTGFYWEVKGGAIVSGQGTHRATIQWNGLAPWYIRVTAENAEGCWSDTLHTDIFIFQDPTYKVSGPTEVCKGELVTLFSAAGSNFQWSTGDTTATINFIAEKDTTFFLIVETPCTQDTLYHSVKVFDQPVAQVSSDKDTVFINEPIIFNASWNAGNMEWEIENEIFINRAQLVYRFQYPGEKLIKVVVTNGNCYDTIYKSVYVWEAFKIYIPNTFTPNNNGKNELFVFKGFGIAKFEAYILDRWGNEVYHWNDELENGWDGTFQGEPLPQDVYVYRILAWDYRGRYKEYIGNVNLIR